MSEQQKVTLKYSGLGPVSMSSGAGGVWTIRPGVSALPVDAWEKMKKQPDIAKMLERGSKYPNDYDKKSGLGNLVVVSGDKKPVVTSSDDSGSTSSETGSVSDSDKTDSNSGSDSDKTGSGSGVPMNSAKDAKELVTETEDTKLLKEWLSGEERPSVKNAIEKKLAEIEKERETSKKD